MTPEERREVAAMIQEAAEMAALAQSIWQSFEYLRARAGELPALADAVPFLGMAARRAIDCMDYGVQSGEKLNRLLASDTSAEKRATAAGSLPAAVVASELRA